MSSQLTNPFLLLNWHSLTETDESFEKNHRCFTLTSQLDHNGAAIYKDYHLKTCRESPFKTSLSNALPFYVSPNVKCLNNDDPNFVSRNCLLYCPNEQLLLIGSNNGIKALSIEEFGTENDDDDLRDHIDESHRISSNLVTNDVIFSHHTHRITENLTDNFNNKRIIELKRNRFNNETEISVYTKGTIELYFLNAHNNESDELTDELTPIDYINSKSLSRKSYFSFADRNSFFRNEILISFASDNRLINYDIETNDIIWTANKTDHHINCYKQCSLFWCLFHRQQFIYSLRDSVNLIDIRGRNNVCKLFDNECLNLYEWEQFYCVRPDLCNDYQFWIGTDYRIICGDIRYPKENLIQLNHMLPSSSARFLESALIHDNDDHKIQTVAAGNLQRICLMSFKNSKEIIQQLSLHYPLHVPIPIDYRESQYLCGIQLIPLKKRKGFTVTQMTNYGDIMINDYFDDKINDDSNDESDSMSEKYLLNIKEYLKKILIDENVKSQTQGQCKSCNIKVTDCQTINGVCVCRGNVLPKLDDTHDEQQYADTTEIDDCDLEDDDNDDDESVKREKIKKLFNKRTQFNGSTDQFCYDVFEMITDNEVFDKHNFDDYTKSLFKAWNVIYE